MPILNRRNISPGEPHDTETVLCGSGRGRWSRASNGTSPPAYFIKEEALPSGGIWGDTTGIDSSLRTFYPFFKKEDVMPVSKNKPTTLSPEGSTSQSASNPIRLAGRNFASIYGIWP